MFNFHFESVQDRLGIQNTKYIKYNIYHRSKTSLNLFSYLQFTNVMILKYFNNKKIVKFLHVALLIIFVRDVKKVNISFWLTVTILYSHFQSEIQILNGI